MVSIKRIDDVNVLRRLWWDDSEPNVIALPEFVDNNEVLKVLMEGKEDEE